MPEILIAGTHSGVGKTTVAMALMAAFARRYVVAPFKVGPDYIDPSHHTAICGRPSRNLDMFMMGEDGVRETFARAAAGTDICVIEGAMGLYDGMGSDDTASAAHVARVLGLPVILVVDVKGVSRSAAAIVKGYCDFDKRINVAGVILNKVGSPRHGDMVRTAIQQELSVPVVGEIPKSSRIELPSRHLGLYMAHEGYRMDYVAELESLAEDHIDMPAIQDIAQHARDAGYAAADGDNSGADGSGSSVSDSDGDDTDDRGSTRHDITIGVARDPAFCFYYADLIDSLKRDANLVFWSPLADDPPEADGFYFGGGYPELYVKELSACSKTGKEIRNAAADGVPIYGECGGMIYLCESLIDLDGNVYPMAGVLPAETTMTNRLQALGYTDATVSGNPVVPKGRIRGHEFHYSVTDCAPDARFAYRMNRGKGIRDGMDGILEYATLGSYMHAPPSFDVSRFIESCRRHVR
uniref:Cobyrinate a,c-diamide synthase n=1 Tax=Candidatus Methanogaster sp. ANME-2c ERB4 TaxID=2759911 RepID=A0A7G9YQ90_9EURY|nr:cobyrinate a,c-diamide synthase [Methanosarcinales archaeon ANME-2c ERB4]